MIRSTIVPRGQTAGIAAVALLAASLMAAVVPAHASSHMDAPLITLDDAANTTDVYAFVTKDGNRKLLTTALSVYPFEEPGIGPNIFRFDDDVRYEIHVATGSDVRRGRATFTFRFEFVTSFRSTDSILQAFSAPIGTVGGPGQNLVQTYTVTRIDRRSGTPVETVLGTGIVPPNNQGRVTPLYNEAVGEGPALGGVARFQDLDPYTAEAVVSLPTGYRFFAGQRDDGFYADIQAVFDLLAFRTGDDVFDSQGGFNVHTIVLAIPVEDLGGERQLAGVYATTSRRSMTVLRPDGRDEKMGEFVQVGRQGNPLFCEGFVALADKDLYNRTSPERDRELFRRYASAPELARLIGVNATGRRDVVRVFIPDLIKVDLSTGPARLAGGGPEDAANPDEPNFSRLGVFGPAGLGDGGDVLRSSIVEGFGGGLLPGGWPNGRRFGDDVLDIAVSLLLSDLEDLRNPTVVAADGIDNVDRNDISFHRVFPYAATPLNGRNHGHHGHE